MLKVFCVFETDFGVNDYDNLLEIFASETDARSYINKHQGSYRSGALYFLEWDIDKCLD